MVPQGDLHVLSQVLHNWDDEHVRRIARQCHRASRPGGALMVIEYVLPDGPEPSLAHLMDLIMMMAVGGRERTVAEHEALLGAAGYRLVRDTPRPACCRGGSSSSSGPDPRGLTGGGLTRGGLTRGGLTRGGLTGDLTGEARLSRCGLHPPGRARRPRTRAS